MEIEQQALRRNLLEVLDGKRHLPVAVFEQKFPPLADEPPIEPREAGKE